MIRRFRKVTKNLYRGSAPSPVDVVNLKNKLNINRIVSLDRESGNIIHNIASKLGIDHVMIPVDGRKSSLMNLFQYDFKQLFLEDGPVFVHCQAGKDRTGLVIALIKCKYLHENPERAIAEAKSLGFGVGIKPSIIHLYENLIRSCKPEKYSADADIVSNEREYIDDNRGSVLDSAQQGSFAPYLDQTKSFPNDVIYLSDLEQPPTRENYQEIWGNKKHKNSLKENSDNIPLIGTYNNDASGRGAGPIEPMTGFFYE